MLTLLCHVVGNCSASGRFNPNYPTGSPWVSPRWAVVALSMRVIYLLPCQVTSVGGLTGGVPGTVPSGEVRPFGRMCGRCMSR